MNPLLDATLRNALRTTFYRKLWGVSDVEAASRGGLSALPIVSRSMIASAGCDAQIRDGLCNDVLTKGSTGRPLVTIRGEREQQAIHRFSRRELIGRSNDRLRRGVRFNNIYHGYHVQIPSPYFFHSVGIYDRGCFDYARGALLRAHDDLKVESHCSLLSGVQSCLRAFTLDTLKTSENSLATHLRKVASHGEILIPTWRTLLQSVWGCPVVDRYSLSEVVGGATENKFCGWYHFDPFVLPEVICTSSKHTLEEGIGELVLTALFPFQEAQPLIRYATGDVVEVTHSCACGTGDLAIVPLGRAIHCVRDADSHEWCLSERDILEILHRLNFVKRPPLFVDAIDVKDKEAASIASYQLGVTHEGGRTIATVSTEFKGRAPSSRLINDFLRRTMVEVSNGAARLMDAGKLIVCIAT